MAKNEAKWPSTHENGSCVWCGAKTDSGAEADNDAPDNSGAPIDVCHESDNTPVEGIPLGVPPARGLMPMETYMLVHSRHSRRSRDSACLQCGRMVWRTTCATIYLAMALICVMFIWVVSTGALQVTAVLKA